MHDDAADYHGLQVTRSPREVLQRPAGHPGCQYYGNSHYVLHSTGNLLTSGGNECAVIFTSYAPCKMEIAGAQPDQAVCPLAEEYTRLAMRMEKFVSHRKAASFLAAETEVPVEKSVGEITDLLVRSGARSLRMDYEGQRVCGVSFDLLTPAGVIPYKLPLRIDPVFQRLQKARPPGNRVNSAERDRAQAERTAWRLLVWWLKARSSALSTWGWSRTPRCSHRTCLARTA
jgi:hypothetical protein